MPIKHLYLPSRQYESVVRSLKESGYVCKEERGFAVCRKPINEIQVMTYILEEEVVG